MAGGVVVLGVQPEADGQLMCLECERWLRALGAHLRVHEMTAAEYRYRHELPATMALVSADLRETFAAHGRKHYPERREVLRPDEATRARSLRKARQAMRDSAARAGTRRLLREQAAGRALRQSQEAAARHEAQVRALGYTGLAAFFAAHDSYPDRYIAGLLEVSESTAGTLRSRHAGDREVTGAARRAQQTRRSTRRTYDERAARAGFTGITELLQFHTGRPDREIAQLLGVSVQTANRIRRDPRMTNPDPG